MRIAFEFCVHIYFSGLRAWEWGPPFENQAVKLQKILQPERPGLDDSDGP